jgi:hypothetical protein
MASSPSTTRSNVDEQDQRAHSLSLGMRLEHLKKSAPSDDNDAKLPAPSAKHTITTSGPRFLDLPLELRDMIYAYGLGGNTPRGHLGRIPLRGFSKDSFNLRLTCHEIRNETHTSLYRHNTIHVTYDTSFPKRIKLIARPQLAAIRFLEFETDALDNVDWVGPLSVTAWSTALKATCASHLPGLVHAQFISNYPLFYYPNIVPPNYVYNEVQERAVRWMQRWSEDKIGSFRMDVLRYLKNIKGVAITVTARLRNEYDRFYGGRRGNASKSTLRTSRS